MRTLLLALLLFSSQAHSQEYDKSLLVTSTGLLLVDWLQTRSIARNPRDYVELNPILGPHPTVGRVNTHFAAAIALNYLISENLSGKTKTGWLIGITILEGTVTARNMGIGIRLDL